MNKPQIPIENVIQGLQILQEIAAREKKTSVSNTCIGAIQWLMYLWDMENKVSQVIDVLEEELRLRDAT